MVPGGWGSVLQRVLKGLKGLVEKSAAFLDRSGCECFPYLCSVCPQALRVNDQIVTYGLDSHTSGFRLVLAMSICAQEKTGRSKF